MATTKAIEMSEFNGTDYDTLLPYGTVKTIASVPTSSTKGIVGELLLCLYGTPKVLYQCVSVSGNTYNWVPVGSLSTNTYPSNLAANSSIGSSQYAARADHVHALPSLTQLGAQGKIRYGTAPVSTLSGTEGDIYIMLSTN